MGGGGGSQRSETRTDIPEELKPFVTFGVGEARRLYEQGGPQYYPGQTFVSPSEATQTALGLAERRALAGSPLLQQAQQTIAGQMGYTSPYAQQIQQLGMSAADPSGAFYRSMMEGGAPSEAQEMARRTASGAFLEPNEYLKGALAQANRLAAESFQEGIQDIQSRASAAGRYGPMYGSGSLGQLVGKSEDRFARAIAEQTQQAYLQNYMQERAAQERAISSLGSMEQQDIANRFAGAGGLTTGEQQALATRIRSLGAAQDITAQDLARQQQAASMAPGLAAQDYADIQRLADIGAAREGQAGAQLQADMQRFAYEQNLPYQELQRYAGLISGTPMGTTTTQTATPTGGK